tara:strand:+ start:17906 stop:21238 length:3333 start_codon:yes stop_codon:yes gene_type:complete
MTFTPDTLVCFVGDTVTINPGGYHNAVEVDDSTWMSNGTNSNGGFNIPLGTPSGSFVIDQAKTYYYVCTPHVTLGMKGVIISSSPAMISGCTDSVAANFDSLATLDDGSCNYYLSNHDNLFFSEWGEGSSWNKYFELYNPTTDTIYLSNYAFPSVSGNPNTTGVYEYWNNFDSASFILPNDIFVVAHYLADSSILQYADMTVTSSTALGNGDDGIALIYGSQPNSTSPPSDTTYRIIDWIGDWNGDPGQGWSVSGVGAATRNHTIIRKCNIFQGDTSWINSSANQWLVKPIDYWTNIGTHNYNNTIIDSQSYIICNGLSIVVGVNTYDSSGIYYDTLSSFNGCDSVVVTDLTVLSNSASIVSNNITICDGDSLVVGSSIYFNSGNFIDTLLNSSGCDSIINTNLFVQTPQFYNITICDGDSLTVGLSVYYSGGNFIDTLVSSIGCDSIIHTNLTIYSQYNPIFGGIPSNNVGGGNFYSGSQYLEMSCYVSSELVSAVVYAQDTVIETFEIRDVNGNVLDDTTVTVVPGGHRVYFNYIMSAGTNYELGVNGNSNNLFRHNSGVNYPYNFGSLASITSSSASSPLNYYYYYYDIEVRQSSQPVNYYICDGQSITISGNIYDSSGIYIDTLVSSHGCDSLLFTNLVVYPNYLDSNYQTICSGETYLIGNNIYDSSGVYLDTLFTLYGCDSVIVTNLTVDSIVGGSSVNQLDICIGDSIVVGNNVYNSSGVYMDTLSSSNGCDSIITNYLNVVSASYNSLNIGLPDSSIYSGDYSNYNGYLILDASILTLLKSATVYSADTNSVTFELRNNLGIVMQSSTHMVYPGSQILTFNFMIPPGTDYQLGVDGGNSGLFRNNAGNGNSISYPFNLGSINITSSNAGDQYYYFYYDIEIMQFGSDNPQTICEGDSIVVGNSVYNIPGVYVDTFSSVNSCDSLVYTDLQYYPNSSLSISSLPSPAEICLGDTILLEASQGFSEFYWIYSNAIIGQNQNILLSPTEDTWYILKAIDQYGCVVQEDIWVYVDTCFVGLEDAIINNISIYPNPSFGIFNIDFNKVFDNNLNIRIVNSLGALVISEELKEGQRIKEFNLSEFSKGIYFIELHTETGLYKKKIILK